MSVTLPNLQASEDHSIDLVETPASPASLSLYLAGLIACLCGLLSAHLTLEDYSFANLTISLMVIGFMTSYVCRVQNISASTIETPAVILFATILLISLLGGEGLPLLTPSGNNMESAQGLGMLLTWLVVFWSFLLSTDSRLLFSCIPTLALIGLVNTMNTDPMMTTLAVIFVCAAIFMLVHESYLRARTDTRQSRKPEQHFLSGQVQLAGLCSVAALLIANIVAMPIRALGSYLVYTLAFNVANKQTSTSGPTISVRFSESQEVRIATGPVQLSDLVVMRVQAEHGAYWRGTSYDQYTGHSWINTFSSDIRLLPNSATGDLMDPSGATRSTNETPRFDVRPTPIMQAGPHSHLLRQTMRLEGPGVFFEVYAASEPNTIRMNQIQAIMNQAGTIQLQTPMQSTSYEVVSKVADWSPEKLRTLPEKYEGPSPVYLQLPSEDSDAIARIREAAVRVTAGIHNAYDKVEALRNWISTQCKYNSQAPAAPTDQDVVSYFLFTKREGYCDSFATSLAVLCRTIGIPARVASGFLPGELDPEKQEYQVRERDKHQWTEVYFPNVGWVTFDATENTEDVSPNSPHAASKKGQGFLKFLLSRGWLPPTILFVFLCLVCYVVKVEVWDRFRVRRSPNSVLGLPPTNEAIILAYMTACAILARKGLSRPPSATPMEFLETVISRLEDLPGARAALAKLTELAIRFRYGPYTASEDDVQAAVESLKALKAALKRSQMRSLALAAARTGGGA